MNQKIESDVSFIGFALNDCVVEVDEQLKKYLRVVHRTALELAVQNRFGAEIGGFWLLNEQIQQLRTLTEYYPSSEAYLVRSTIEAYLRAQLDGLYSVSIPQQHIVTASAARA